MSSEFLSFRLPDDFIKSYSKKKVRWGFPIGEGNSLGELTYLSKYSRKKEDGKKERWHETCRRVIEGMYSILKDHCNENRTPWNEYKAQKAAQDAYDRLFYFKWTPPGRGLWMMGSSFIHENKSSAALQNCFVGSEKFITLEYGPVSFLDVVGETVQVMTREGWKKADVSEFGEQSVQRVTFAPAMPNPRGEGYKKARSNHRVDVTVTRDHRWILADDTETTSLSVGDTVHGKAAHAGGDEYWDGFVHGLIFGDGVKITHRYVNGDYGYELRACDERTQGILLGGESNAIASRFDKITLDRLSADGDPIAYKRSSVEMKEFPDGASVSYLGGFLHGWITADASIEGETVRLGSQHPEARLWIEENAATAGYVLTGVNQDPVMETNYGVRKHPMMRFTLRKDDNVFWKVESIRALPEKESVYCATVPDTGSFVLASGINTGNCAFISTDKLSPHSAREATLPFIRLMEMSMLGVGVGFDTLGAGNLELHQPNPKNVETYTVDDSREGWYESTGALLESFFFKNRPWLKFDYSEVRPAGQPIKGFGGTAAGPEPLMELHESIRVQFSGREGERITSTDIVDLMNKIGKCVVAGNVRRSAEIALGQPDDAEFLDLKSFELNPERMGILTDVNGNIIYDQHGAYQFSEKGGWGFTSNNSLSVEVGNTDYSEIAPRIEMNGEPGLLYLDLCQNYSRLIDPPDQKDRRAAGTNPCVTSDTWVMTAEGPAQVYDLVDVPFVAVVDGEDYHSEGFWKTGDKEVLKIVFSDGRELKVTPDHRILSATSISRYSRNDEWVEAGDLDVGDMVVLNDHSSRNFVKDDIRFDDGYVVGHLIGDGTFSDGRARLNVWDQDEGVQTPKKVLQKVAERRGVPSSFRGWSGPHGNGWHVLSTVNLTGLAASVGVVQGNKTITKRIEGSDTSFAAGVLRGLFDTDGSVQGDHRKGFSVRLAQSDKALLQAAQRMLLRFGINSSIYQRAGEGESFLPNGRGGYDFYPTKAHWELVISKSNIDLFEEHIGFYDDVKSVRLLEGLGSLNRNPNRERYVTTVTSIEPVGVMPVYDASVETVHAFDANGIYVHNCGEQTLESYECCVTGDTLIQTRYGLERIHEIVGEPVEIWNGESWSEVEPFSTGVLPVYRVTMSDGSILDATPEHEWLARRATERTFKEVTTESLEPGMVLPEFELPAQLSGKSVETAYEYGWFVGDGYMDGKRPMALVQESEYEILESLRVDAVYSEQSSASGAKFKRVSMNGVVPWTTGLALRDHSIGLPPEVLGMDAASIASFMAGWIDTDGSVIRNPNTDHFVLYGDEQKLRDAQILLRRIGVNHSTLREFAAAGSETNLGVRKSALYRLLIPSYEAHLIPTRIKIATRFGSRYGVNNAYPASQIDRARKQKIVSVEIISEGEETFCFNEPELHRGVFGNVLTKQCTLVETYISNHDDFEDYEKTLKQAYLYGKAVTLMSTHWPETNEVMQRNRRIGCSITGVAQFIEAQGWIELRKWMNNGYGVIEARDSKYSEWLGVRESIKKTSIKPSGTVSILAGVTPGVHLPTASGQYIRRIRYAVNDPVAAALIEAGYYCEPDVQEPDATLVFEFPTYGPNVRDERQVTMWEKAEMAVVAQRYWADNQVSVTVTFKPEEAEQIPALLQAKEGQLKSISFLPLGEKPAFAQMPYEKVDDKQFDVRLSKVKPIDFKSLYAGAALEGEGEKFCNNDVCVI